MSALGAFEGIWGSSNPPSTAPVTSTNDTGPVSNLSGRAIVVTGCASGIGRAVAHHLAERGVRLALTDKDAQGGRELCQEIKQRGLKVDMAFAALDVTDENAVGKLMRTFKKSYKRLDGLVNCAGVNFPPRSVTNIDLEYYTLTMDTNLKGTFAFCKHFVASLKRDEEDQIVERPNGGYSIVNIGSNASLNGIENTSIYCASKHAVLGFSRSLAREVASQNCRVNVAAPGPIDTPLLHQHFANTEQEEQSLDQVIDQVPMQRFGKPEEVANVVGFLLGSESSYVTGAVIPVDGFSQLSEKVSSSLPSSNSFQSIAGIEGKSDGTVYSGPSEGGTGGGTRLDRGGRKGKWWDDEGGTSVFSISLRGAQTFFPFINLCIYIALAAFQSRWKVGVSFLVGLSLFFNIEALLHGGLLLSTALAADKLKFLRSLDRIMRQIRVAAIINTFQAFCMVLLA
ncbi:SDR family NAD(P)-dependent oxidoreductase, partial [Sporobolomyces salmoneus]|uniref:SDR family NAD(P)-dependent oxidoreductase n=1 Tax=Sporobolomyces salmoneus TaxID=183962 RepID=UPI00317409CF